MKHNLRRTLSVLLLVAGVAVLGLAGLFALQNEADANRAAVYQSAKGHTVHDESANYFLLFDQRSALAADTRRRYVNVSGGMAAWAAAGLPLVNGRR